MEERNLRWKRYGFEHESGEYQKWNHQKSDNETMFANVRSGDIGKCMRNTAEILPRAVDRTVAAEEATAIEWNRSGADRRTASTSSENSRAVGLETPQSSPTASQRPSDAMASDPLTSDDDDNDEDPGEGQRSSEASSRKGAAARKRDEASMTSGEAEEEELEGTSKRELEGAAAEEPEATRPRVDEGSGQVEERPEIQREEPSGTVRRIMATRSVQEVASFLRKDLPKYHDDEEVELEEFEGLEVEFEEPEEERSSELGEDEEFEESMPKWSNKFEDEPSKVDEDELTKVDVVSREHEISRLTEMKVLKELPEGTSVSNYKYLSTKVVYDWRHRDSEWQRRGRLVAREFKWLGSTDIATLFSPTGVASTVKLLSAMFVSSNDHILGSIDVGDAYLMVEQEEPTVVEVDGKYYELGFTLPGQRIGSSAWFNKLKGYLEECWTQIRRRTTSFVLQETRKRKSWNGCVVAR